jgi:hypothetical protein
MPNHKTNDAVTEPPSPWGIACSLMVNTIVDECEVEIRCQRTNGVDRVFAPSMDWLRAERPSESTLATSVETLMPGIIAKCLNYIGKPVNVRAGLLSKECVETIIRSICLEMDKIKKQNEVSRETEIVTKAAQLGLSPEPSSLMRGTWLARCPGTNHTLELQPKQNLFYCGYCKVGGGIDKLEKFTAKRTGIYRVEAINLLIEPSGTSRPQRF